MYDLVDQTFGNLTVLELSLKKTSQNKPLWKCRCICGNINYVLTYDLRAGKSTSCGKCKDHIIHKDAYISWMAAKGRCNNPSNKDYARYGGKGIAMSIPWQLSFKNFLNDMGDPPLDKDTGERLSLDRVDTNGDYCKENCRWATRSEQQLNKTNSAKPKTKDPLYRYLLKLERGEY